MCGDPISGSISPNECNDITSHPISSNRILSDKMTVAGRDTTIFRGLRLKSRLVLRGSAVACRSIREHGIFRTVERGVRMHVHVSRRPAIISIRWVAFISILQIAFLPLEMTYEVCNIGACARPLSFVSTGPKGKA